MIKDIHSWLISTQAKMLEQLQYVAIVTGRSGLRGVIRVSISRVGLDTLIYCMIFIRKQDSITSPSVSHLIGVSC